MKGSRPWNADESSVSGNCYGGHAVAIENTTLKKTDDGVCWHCFCGSVFEDSMEGLLIIFMNSLKQHMFYSALAYSKHLMN
ncbi:hypothetical protein OUZ56_028730 [Daphnia magna]|uniref:Uncharacterized protein n=1 Tax=Daphnia magna TaxID=35525 RepID=A0ABR0B4W2_9CRUS|nr:hypothetical protein OUZ56_028730 [Daphnia magna]